MSSYFIYYTEAGIVCVIIFGIMLVWDLLSVDKQEKQIKYDRTLIAFLLYFLSDGLWAAIIAGVLPRTRFAVVSVNFANCILMSSITYTWLRYVMALEQIPKRDARSTRIAVLAPFVLSTVALVCTYLLAPDALLNSALEPQPLYSVFLVTVPIIYIIAVLVLTMKWAIAVESRIERRRHILIGLFPLMVVIGVLLAALAGIFLWNRSLNRLAERRGREISTDPLTGLNNRGQLLHYIAQKTNLYREGRLTIVVMFDINDFKQINDTYGHAEGDHALILVADSFREVIRNHSTPMVLARYGGDEFILIAHPTGEAEIEPLICEIREQIKARCREESTPYVVSISAGAEALNGREDTFQRCMQRADKNLYADKAKQKRHRE